MDTELISIIVPVYNVGKYLCDCLDSLVSQNYDNIEILLVDNGSTDGTLQTCQKYAEKYPKIRLLQEGIRQQGRARNRAIKEMKGAYFCYVDGDDYVSENYVRSMYDAAKKYDADLVQCGVVFMLECRDVKKDADKAVRRIQDKCELNGHVWGKLYRSSVYGKVLFTNARMGSDMIYSNEIFQISTNAVICGYCLYGYRSYQGSVTRITPNQEFFLQLNRYIAEGNESEFRHLTQKCIEVVSQRHEEQLYHKELPQLKDCIQQAKTNSLSIDPELEDRLTSMILQSKSTPLKHLYLKLKHSYTSLIAAQRIRSNYRCKLD